MQELNALLYIIFLSSSLRMAIVVKNRLTMQETKERRV